VRGNARPVPEHVLVPATASLAAGTAGRYPTSEAEGGHEARTQARRRSDRRMESGLSRAAVLVMSVVLVAAVVIFLIVVVTRL